jgi:hypothetical protein
MTATRSIKTFFKFAVIAYLAILLGLVIPVHQHADLQQHDNCALCLAQTQPVDSAVSVTLPVFGFTFLVTIIFLSVTYRKISPLPFRSRAPPILF